MSFEKKITALITALAFTAIPVAAQDEESGRMVFSSGLVKQIEETNEHWAYVAWRATETDLLLRRPVAVYAKPGGPEDPGDYERVSVTDVQTEPRTLSAIVGRAQRLGESREDLEARLNEVFHELVPNPDMEVGEKLSAIIQGAIADPDLQENLLLLSRTSPALAMAVGQAFTGRIEEKTTFELRELDSPGGQAIRVFGRTTVDPANPVILPAPGRPHDATLADARGHLNVRLFWAMPERLRAHSLLKYGYNIYRVDRADAELAGWDVEAPEVGELARNAEQTDGVTRVNRLPAMADRTLSEAEAVELAADPGEDDFFFTDDNDRRSPDDPAFEDGEQFYYFVAARDLLGRDGEYSPGTLVTVCARLPPVPPQHIEVENVYQYEAGSGSQFLRVAWRQNDENNERTASDNYYVYRWDSISEMHARSGDPGANLVSGPIPHQSGEAFGHFDDVEIDPPTIEEDAGRTFWYTVRAGKDSACSQNLSGNSPPAYGVLRDRKGPDGPGGYLDIACALPNVWPGDFRPSPVRTTGQERIGLHFSAERLHPEIAWAEFFLVSGGERLSTYHPLGRMYFGKQDDFLEKLREFQVGSNADLTSVDVAARVGTYSGRISAPTVLAAFVEPGYVTDVPFLADVEMVRGIKGEECGDGPHNPAPADPDVALGEIDIQNLNITISLTPGTEEWKLYRRIDDGPMQLLKQGLDSYAEVQEVVVADDAMPASPSTEVCYFAQLFDEHGNASAMIRIDCVEVQHSDLPEPILASATPLEEGEDGRKEIELRWFSSPYGVERFEVWLSPAEKAAEIDTGTLDGPLFEEPVEWPDGESDDPYHAFQTMRVESGFGDGAEFTATIAVEDATEFRAVVRAVGSGAPTPDPDPGGGSQQERASGPFSNEIAFAWFAPDPDPGPEVPWPQRRVPGQADLDDALEVKMINLEGMMPAIRLGEYRFEGFEGYAQRFPLHQEPEDLFFPMENLVDLDDEEEGTSSLFPFAVYRASTVSNQFGNAAPATVVQVTPVINEVAYQSDGRVNTARDPWFIFMPYGQVDPGGPPDDWDPETSPTHEIYFIDHHPFVVGGQYRYLLVRYRPDGEIGQVLVSPTLTQGGDNANENP